MIDALVEWLTMVMRSRESWSSEFKDYQLIEATWACDESAYSNGVKGFSATKEGGIEDKIKWSMWKTWRKHSKALID